MVRDAAHQFERVLAYIAAPAPTPGLQLLRNLLTCKAYCWHVFSQDLRQGLTIQNKMSSREESGLSV